MTLSLSTAQQTEVWRVGCDGWSHWSADYSGGADVVSHQPITTASGDTVCLVVGLGDDDEEFDAKARLIAAAPELLAALKELDAYWLESLPGGPDGSRVVMSGLGTIADDTIAIWKQARAAIAKATQP